MQLDLEYGSLACKLFRTVILGEGYIYIEFITDIFADYLILKAGNELTRAEHQRVTLCLAAVKRLSVNKALEIDYNGIILFSGAVLNGNHTRIALSHSVNLGVNLGSVNLNDSLFSR